MCYMHFDKLEGVIHSTMSKFFDQIKYAFRAAMAQIDILKGKSTFERQMGGCVRAMIYKSMKEEEKLKVRKL